MRLESPFTEVKKSQQTVYKAVNDVARYKEFMPDAVGSFRTGEDFGMNSLYLDRKSTRLNYSHSQQNSMQTSA